MRKKLGDVLAEYGVIAIVLYLAMFVLVLVGAYFALSAGWRPSGVAAKGGTWALAWIIAKLTTPFRLAAAVALSPIVARVVDRVRGKAPRRPETDAASKP